MRSRVRYDSSAAMIACTEIARLDLQSLYGVRGIISNPFAKDVEVDETTSRLNIQSIIEISAYTSVNNL